MPHGAGIFTYMTGAFVRANVALHIPAPWSIWVINQPQNHHGAWVVWTIKHGVVYGIVFAHMEHMAYG